MKTLHASFRSEVTIWNGKQWWCLNATKLQTSFKKLETVLRSDWAGNTFRGCVEWIHWFPMIQQKLASQGNLYFSATCQEQKSLLQGVFWPFFHATEEGDRNVNRIIFTTKTTAACSTSDVILTRSSAEPPPRYSIIIHNLVSCKDQKKKEWKLLTKKKKRQKYFK